MFKTKGTKNGASQNPDRWHIQMSKAEHASARALFEKVGGANIAYLLEVVASQIPEGATVETLQQLEKSGGLTFGSKKK